MAGKQELNIVITKDGEVKIEVTGINGKKCLKETDFLTDDIGEITSQEKTSDFYKEENQDTDIHTGQ